MSSDSTNQSESHPRRLAPSYDNKNGDKDSTQAYRIDIGKQKGEITIMWMSRSDNGVMELAKVVGIAGTKVDSPCC